MPLVPKYILLKVLALSSFKRAFIRVTTIQVLFHGGSLKTILGLIFISRQFFQISSQRTHPVLFLALWEVNTKVKTVLYRHIFPGIPFDKNYRTISNKDIPLLDFCVVGHLNIYSIFLTLLSG